MWCGRVQTIAFRQNYIIAVAAVVACSDPFNMSPYENGDSDAQRQHTSSWETASLAIIRLQYITTLYERRMGERDAASGKWNRFLNNIRIESHFIRFGFKWLCRWFWQLLWTRARRYAHSTYYISFSLYVCYLFKKLPRFSSYEYECRVYIWRACVVCCDSLCSCYFSMMLCVSPRPFVHIILSRIYCLWIKCACHIHSFCSFDLRSVRTYKYIVQKNGVRQQLAARRLWVDTYNVY